MASSSSFPLVRGRRMRVTRLDGCCSPQYGDEGSLVTDGFISVGFTSNVNEPEEIEITNANGQVCVRDTGCPEFQGYDLELTFCNVEPCLFSMITGQPPALDANGEVVGFKMNSSVSLCDAGFALELWMGVPGVACSGDAGAYGYLLVPCISGGVIGDFTVENGAITFTITGSSTKDGNGWGTGPYPDMVLPDPLDADDHLLVQFSTTPPPDVTDGCVELVDPNVPAPVAQAARKQQPQQQPQKAE